MSITFIPEDYAFAHINNQKQRKKSSTPDDFQNDVCEEFQTSVIFCNLATNICNEVSVIVTDLQKDNDILLEFYCKFKIKIFDLFSKYKFYVRFFFEKYYIVVVLV